MGGGDGGDDRGVLLAWVVFGMPTTQIARIVPRWACSSVSSRIAWIIIASIFLYEIAVETGQFRVMKESIAVLSSDKRPGPSL